MAPAIPGLSDEISTFRQKLIAGNRSGGRQFQEYPNVILTSIKTSHPRKQSAICRIGRTQVMGHLVSNIIRDLPNTKPVVIKFVETRTTSRHHSKRDFSDDLKDVEVENDEERSSLAIEREALLTRIVEQFHLVDESVLRIVPGRFVLNITVSLAVVEQDDGCVMDAAFTCLMALLKNVVIPEYSFSSEEEKLQFNWEKITPSAGQVLRRMELVSSLAVFGASDGATTMILSGPNTQEEEMADAVVLIMSHSEQKMSFFHTLRGRFRAALTKDDLTRVAALAFQNKAKLSTALANYQQSTDDPMGS